MADKFEKEGLGVQHFDFSMKELAERLRIDQSPIALVFTAACHSMRNACQGLQLWIDADSNYAEYLQYDIAEMEKKRDTQARLCRDLHLKASNNEFAVKSLKRNVDECDQQLRRLKPKELLLKTEERKLREQNKDVLVDLDIKQYRKLEMQIKGSLTDRDGIERFERLNSEILELKNRKPAIERRITDLEKKQTWISGRASFKNQKEAKLEQAILELRQSRRLARKAQVELERQEACLAKLKEIHLLKTTPETLKKIFHNMPLHSKYSQPSNKQKDRFEKFCRKVGQEIDGDWARLYRALPFYPSRGQETIASDIDDITSRFLRNPDEQAQQALSRWRRWHTRACTNDLRDALLMIRRKDILDKLDRNNQEDVSTVSPKMHRVVHFPKIANRVRKKNHYLHF
ncbi:hypothetical protein ElyMa_003741000 [Elysia marginata]|uniref:Death domain-containing protein n=1 Tax=Elysia marginata TaxID=1093978 RepID=A0AAV4F6V5_9GAST|nr:hypothetical protein ElyMa_003741000 [Elysia marginata]